MTRTAAYARVSPWRWLEEVPPVPAQALPGELVERLTDVPHDAFQPAGIDGQEGFDKGGDPLRRTWPGTIETIARGGLGRLRAGETTHLVLPGMLGRGHAQLGARVRLPDFLGAIARHMGPAANAPW